MTFEKQFGNLITYGARNGCAGCGQNNATKNQQNYGGQAQEHRSSTNKGYASNCSC